MKVKILVGKNGSFDAGYLVFDGKVISEERHGVGKYRDSRRGSLAVEVVYRTKGGQRVVVDSLYSPYRRGTLQENSVSIDGKKIVFLDGRPCGTLPRGFEVA